MYNDEHNLYHYTYRKDGSEAEAHPAPQPGPVQDHNSGPQQPVQEMKPVKKNRIGLKVTALALCCALLGGAVGGALWWAVQHYFVRRDEFEAAVRTRDEHFGRQEARMTTLEAHLAALPSAEQMADLRGDFRALSAQISGMAAVQTSMARQVEMLNQFLLERRA